MTSLTGMIILIVSCSASHVEAASRNLDAAQSLGVSTISDIVILSRKVNTLLRDLGVSFTIARGISEDWSEEQYFANLGDVLVELGIPDGQYVKVRGTPLVLEFGRRDRNMGIPILELTGVYWTLLGAVNVDDQRSAYGFFKGRWRCHYINVPLCKKRPLVALPAVFMLNVERDILRFLPEHPFGFSTLAIIEPWRLGYTVRIVGPNKLADKKLNERALFPLRYSVIVLSDSLCVVWSISQREVLSVSAGLWIRMGKPFRGSGGFGDSHGRRKKSVDCFGDGRRCWDCSRLFAPGKIGKRRAKCVLDGHD